MQRHHNPIVVPGGYRPGIIGPRDLILPRHAMHWRHDHSSSPGRTISKAFTEPPPVIPDPDFVVPNTWSHDVDGYWDGDVQGVSPGDIIQLEAGARDELRFRNIQGVSGADVLIRNDPAGKTTIARETAQTGDFTAQMRDCSFWTMDGGYTPGVPFGIVFTTTQTNDKPTTGMQLTGICDNYTIRNFEVDGNWLIYPSWIEGIGIGIQHNDQNQVEGTGAGEQEWRENILVESFYIHDVRGEGLYLGPNFENPEATNKVPLRNIEVRYGHFARTGRDASQIKSSLEGTNVFHHIYYEDSGLREDETEGGQKVGLGFFEGCGTMHHIWGKNAGEHGISFSVLYRPSSFSLPPYIVHDVNIIDPGVNDDPIAVQGHGIACSRPSGAFAEPSFCEYYNTTIIRAERFGLHIDSSIGADVLMQNNIVSDSGTQNIAAFGSGMETIDNNELGSVAAQNFGSNFALTSSSPARNAAVAGKVSTSDNAGMWAYVEAGADPFDPIGPYAALDANRPLGADECRGGLEFVE